MDKLNEVRVPFSISLCHNGCVCLQFGISIVHLPPEDFKLFIEAANKAVKKLDQSHRHYHA